MRCLILDRKHCFLWNLSWYHKAKADEKKKSQSGRWLKNTQTHQMLQHTQQPVTESGTARREGKILPKRFRTQFSSLLPTTGFIDLTIWVTITISLQPSHIISGYPRNWNEKQKYRKLLNCTLHANQLTTHVRSLHDFKGWPESLAPLIHQGQQKIRGISKVYNEPCKANGRKPE